MNITVLGAGAWGTALAINAAEQMDRRHRVSLWMRDEAQCQRLELDRENSQYLPGIALPSNLELSCVQEEAFKVLLSQSDLVVLASPMSGLRDLLGKVKDIGAIVVWLSKGFEASKEGFLGHEIQVQVAPLLKAGVLSGPSFAQEVALGLPTALVAASNDLSVRNALVNAFHGPSLRIYGTDDIVGVEVGGAVKNVLAIATGFCDGMNLGLNARAALITRGLVEMMRLGVVLGAKSETFMGLSGLGDLVLTGTGDLSRNRRVGLALAHGQNRMEAVSSLGHVAEGVYCAQAVVMRARNLGVDMPISEAVLALLDGRLQSQEVVSQLMGRDPTVEY